MLEKKSQGLPYNAERKVATGTNFLKIFGMAWPGIDS